MAETRVLIDTNVLVSGLAFGGVPGRVIESVRHGRIVGLTSLDILGELRTVLLRPPFSHPLAKVDELAVETATLMEVVVFDEPADRYTVDPDDDRVMLAAVIGNADLIVSGDRHLLGLAEPPVRVVTPAELLASL